MIRIAHWSQGRTCNHFLRNLAYDQSRKQPGSKLGVGTGWSGSKTFFDLEGTERLSSFIGSLIPGREISAWANIMLSGDRVEPHNHRRSHLDGENELAGVYYLTSGGENLILHTSPRIALEPAESMLVIFPAELIHEVEPCRSTEPRISVAFNAK